MTPIARAAGLQKTGLTFGIKFQGQWSKTAKGVKPTKFAQSKWDQAEAFRARLNNDLIDLENKLTVWSPLSSPFHFTGTRVLAAILLCIFQAKPWSCVTRTDSIRSQHSRAFYERMLRLGGRRSAWGWAGACTVLCVTSIKIFKKAPGFCYGMPLVCKVNWLDKLVAEYNVLVQESYNEGTSYLQKTWDSLKAKAEL